MMKEPSSPAPHASVMRTAWTWAARLGGARFFSTRRALALRRLLMPRLLSLKRPFSPRLFGRPMSRSETGLAGEILAARWLEKNGRKILRSNFFSPARGEVDIVARHGQVLTFIEVKTLTAAGSRRPSDKVNEEKRDLIRRGARYWLQMLKRPEVPCRFDIVEVWLVPGELPRLQVIENAFGLDNAR